MACVDLSANADSEMEEGEIVDEADVLSDISSEEEFLLRQRLQVLENYNNVLERKEAKRTSIGSAEAPITKRILGKEHHRREVLCDLSETSQDNTKTGFKKITLRIANDKKCVKPHQKPKRLRPIDRQFVRHKEHKKKNHRKKRGDLKNFSDSSSDDEYVSKRRKLSDAVSLNNIKNDKSTLKDRLTKMLNVNKTEIRETNENHPSECTIEVDKIEEDKKQEIYVEDLKHVEEESNLNQVNEEPKLNQINEVISPNYKEDDLKIILSTDIMNDIVDSGGVVEQVALKNNEGTSDEDLEMLRQYALKTKTGKVKVGVQHNSGAENKTDIVSEEEDSDTAELRMICLKSALLKKAIEMKQKQKLQKRLSQSSNLHDFGVCSDDVNVDNNTDIESVDMEIGSDGDDKGKVYITECTQMETKTINVEVKGVTKGLNKDDELEEDEDLLRAKLLTSLSKNMPNLVNLNVLDNALNNSESKSSDTPKQNRVSNTEKKKFIIQLGESDSEAEHEATKNLTKMHIKLSEQAEFQQQLDLFLKSTRMEVEKSKSPDVVQEPVTKTPEKMVVKTMNHLPKSEQIEYKNLLKRVAELEKIKQARQNTVTVLLPMAKDTLKPRNISIESYKLASAKKLEEKIAISRKRIAVESAKMLKLKEESTNLSQRYKIVATELRNISTAIAFNKKQQRIVHNGLSKIRHQHQILLKSSPINYSSRNLHLGPSIDKIMTTTKLQKENDPLKKEEFKNPNNLKAVKVSVVNDLNICAGNTKLSVHVDIGSNKKTVKLPKSPLKDRIVDFKKHSPKKLQDGSLKDVTESKRPEIDSRRLSLEDELIEEQNDYKSPLDALQCKNWEEDPNGVLCPFEFSGSCRDADCKYIHPKIPK